MAKELNFTTASSPFPINEEVATHRRARVEETLFSLCYCCYF